jgi:glucosamine-6-phosphate deaminase
VKISIHDNPLQVGKAAGLLAAGLIQESIEKKGQANIILATGTSQLETLNQLIKESIDWSRVCMFHLDEYIGLPETSPASFRKYLKERFIQKVDPLKEIHLVSGEGDPLEECQRLGVIIKKMPIDLALVGIGENGHLGFNDPPADFGTEDPFIVVDLDEQCRQQQFGEGWFKTVEDVPRKAITMSIKQIMKSGQIICSVPESRKAIAVKNCLEIPVCPEHPASILQLHNNCVFFLDKSSSALLSKPQTEFYGDQINRII